MVTIDLIAYLRMCLNLLWLKLVFFQLIQEFEMRPSDMEERTALVSGLLRPNKSVGVIFQDAA